MRADFFPGSFIDALKACKGDETDYVFSLKSFQVYVKSEKQAQLVDARVCFGIKLSRGRFAADKIWFPRDGEARRCSSKSYVSAVVESG